MDSEVHKRQTPVWTYLKSRGFYAGVQIDGTIVIERYDENEKFYNEKISVGDILAGKVKRPPERELHMLMETLKAAQGDQDVDESALPESGLAPSDMEIEAEGMDFPLCASRVCVGRELTLCRSHIWHSRARGSRPIRRESA